MARGWVITLNYLGVTNNGIEKTAWSIEAAGTSGIYLKGARKTVFGEQKITFLCSNSKSRLVAWAFFSPQGHANDLVKMAAISVFIDGHQIRLPFDPQTMKPFIQNGWGEIIVPLNDSLISQLMKAKTFGVVAQFAYEAPVFLGIDSLDFVEGAQKLPGFLKSCH